MKTKHFLIAYACIIALIVILIAIRNREKDQVIPSPAPIVINNFEECEQAGHPIQESFPRRCAVPGGQSYTDPNDEQTALDTLAVQKYADKISVNSPARRSQISSPLIISGNARGTWFFEASFPVRLEDANGTTIASGTAQAEGDWMTEDFVPFKATLNFVKPSTATALLILIKDNPSGLPEHDDQFSVPVSF